MSGGLASGGFALSPETLLSFLLVWLLADPVLGVVWGLGVGGSSSAGTAGIWERLRKPHLPDAAPPMGLLPYTQPNSPGRRLAERLGRLRFWWQSSFWPKAGREFATLVAALGLALLLGAILGRNALALVLLSLALSWLAVLSKSESAPVRAHQGIVTLWRALGEFGIPWLIGALVWGRLTGAIIALGGCYTITYFGLIRRATGVIHKFRLIAASQATAVLLLAGLRHPLAAGTAAILLMPQWGLHVWTAARLGGPSGGQLAASGPFLRRVQPFVVLGLLVAALAIGL